MRRNSSSARLGITLGFGLTVFSLAGAMTASAATISATDCATQSGSVTVRAVAINAGQTLTLQQQPDFTYQGQGEIEVYCKASNGTNLGDVSDAQVKITISPTDPSMTMSEFVITGNGVGTTNVNPATPGNPVYLGPLTGLSTFKVTAPSTLLPPGVASADIGVQFETVTQAYGAPLTDPTTGATLKPGTFGDVLAATPELDSLMLFGSGALALGGYALMRRRASR